MVMFEQKDWKKMRCIERSGILSLPKCRNKTKRFIKL